MHNDIYWYQNYLIIVFVIVNNFILTQPVDTSNSNDTNTKTTTTTTANNNNQTSIVTSEVLYFREKQQRLVYDEKIDIYVFRRIRLYGWFWDGSIYLFLLLMLKYNMTD